MRELLTTREIAEYLRLRSETVLRKVAKGEIPAIKVGGRFRFDKDQIDEWLRQKLTSKKRVLVIDDEETIRHLFRETLEADNYHVITAADGAEALELVRSWNFDLIFADLKMPGMNGAETFRQIRRIDRSVPVVIITGYPASDLMGQALEHGPVGVMKKPINGLDIERSVDSFIAGAKAKDRLTEGFQRVAHT
ncbi:MAG: response regulator [Dehalococcoidia bacterium]|nr:response regulator [Dehalococcoidia bacterium]